MNFFKHPFKQACCQSDFLWLVQSRRSAGSRIECIPPGLVNTQESLLAFLLSLSDKVGLKFGQDCRAGS